MNKLKKYAIVLLIFFLNSCVNIEISKNIKKEEKKYYSSFGFALVYTDLLYDQKLVTKKINHENIEVIHSFLKRNTLVKIINPINLKSVNAKVIRNANYPKIFNIVVTKKIATLIELDLDNPYIEIIELKKNKTFIAKRSDMFEEEKKVAEKAPVEKIEMNDLSRDVDFSTKNIITENTNYFLVIADFYYFESAANLKRELVKKLKNNNFFVKRINDNKFRLSIGPFKNFNALKSSYISLNNLGFDDLNIYRE